MSKQERDYVLGTHDAEMERLGIQHYIWRPHMLECWRKAGISTGHKVLDIGAGPGYASFDLVDIVGRTGEVFGVERSARFIKYLRKTNEHRKQNVEVVEMDLMTDDIPKDGFDFSWCRWVNIFVNSPKTLIQKNHKALKKGGLAIFHEYGHYESLKALPASPLLEEFVQHTFDAWRSTGGEPNVAIDLPSILVEEGFAIEWVKPLVFVINKKDFMWQWPMTYIDINLDRLQEINQITPEWAAKMRAEAKAIDENPNAFFITPMVLEIVARKL